MNQHHGQIPERTSRAKRSSEVRQSLWGRAIKNRVSLILLGAFLLGLAVLTGGNMPEFIPSAAASSANMKLPFAAGSTWSVMQGYNTSPKEGGSHYNCDPSTLKDAISQSESCGAGWQYKYSLDLVRADGNTTGQQVLSPVTGTIRWIDPSTGGMSINLGDGYAFAFFHVNLEPSLAAGQQIQTGQILGTIAPAGVANSGNTAHIHIAIWQTTDGGNWSRNAVPFTGALAIDGYSFPDLGSSSRNQHRTKTVLSSNTPLTTGGNGIPGTPTLKTPTNNTAFTSTKPKVAFTWNSVSGASEYQVVINDTIFGPWVTGTAWTSDGIADGSYFWRVRARNANGTGLLSASWKFTVTASGTVTPPPSGNLGVVLSSTSGTVGSTVTVTGTGFGASENVTLCWDSATATPLTTIKANANGSFATTVVIPDAKYGSHTLHAVGATSAKTSTATYAVSPSLARTPTEGIPGTSIAVTVKGFGASEDVRLNWQSPTGAVLGTVRTNAVGTGTITITLPGGKPDWNDYTGLGLTSGVRAYGAIKVLSSITLSPTSAAAGTTVTVNAVGLTPGASASVAFNKTGTSAGTTVCTGTVKSDGSLVCSFAVPAVGAGAYPVVITAGGVSQSTSFTVVGPPAVKAVPTTGASGTNVTMSVGGFQPSERVDIVWGSNGAWQSITADTNGVATLIATVPQVPVGNQVVKATGATSKRSATTSFSVTSAPAAGTTSMIGVGTYNVTATREGLVGGQTSSGHVIVEGDYFVSIPACTPTNCPGGPYWGQMTNCGDKCYVKVTNPASGQCRVEPIYDTGPWFRVDDWWNTQETRYLNKLASNPNKLAQGYTGADAARSGLNVGYGTGAGGIGSSDVYSVVGNRSAIDLADGTWTAIGLPFAQGLANGIQVQMIWQTGANPATEAANCGHPLNQTPGGNLQLTATSGIVGSGTTVNGSGYRSGETVTLRWDTASGPQLATVTVTASGTFSRSITIPEAPYGSHPIYARGNTSGKSEFAPFSIRAAVTRTPTYGSVGSRITVTATGFGAGEVVQLNWDNASGPALGTVTTNSKGTATIIITVPAATVGWHDYTGYGRTSTARAFGAIEVRAGGTTYPPGTANPSLTGGKLPVTTSSSTGTTTASTRAVDGSLATSWYTTGNNPTTASLTIDYGSNRQMTGVRWNHRLTGGAAQFLIETSVDGSTWTTVGTYGQGAENTWYGVALQRSGRYLRLTYSNSTNAPVLGYLGEVELWGIAGSTPTPTPTGTPPPLNPVGNTNPSFSGGRFTATGSTSGGGSTSPSAQARDGNLGSSWYTTGANPVSPFVTVDFGSVKQLTGVRWNFRLAGGGSQFLVQTSTDGSTWSTVGTYSQSTPGGWFGVGLSRTGRYVRVTFANPTNAPVLGYLSEIELWGVGGATPTPTPTVTPPPSNPVGNANPSFSGGRFTATGSTSGGGSTSPSAQARDGNLGSSWYTTGTNPVSPFLTVDFGSVKQLSGVRWNFRLAGGGNQFLVQTSTDGSTWSTVGTFSQSTPGGWFGVGLSTTGRYVRVTFANPTNAPVLGYLSEIELWGAGGVVPTTPTPASTAIPGNNPTFPGSQLAIVTSTGSNGTNASTRAHDGSQGTSWYTTDASPTSADLTIDLGKTQQLSGIKWMYRLTDGADRMILQTSTNGTTWTQLVITSNRQPLTWEGWATTVQARYIRLTFQNPNGKPVLGYVAEVQAWGPNGAAAGSARAASVASPIAGSPVASASPIATMSQNATPVASEPVTTPPDDETGAGTPTPTAEATETIEGTPTGVDAVTPEATIEPTAEANVTAYVGGTDGAGAFCRSTPDGDGEVLALLPDGSIITITGSAEGDWQPVICEDVPGFVYRDYVTMTPPDGLPDPTATPAGIDPTAEPIIEESPEPTVDSDALPTPTEDPSQPAEDNPTPATGEETAVPPTLEPTVEVVIPTLEPTFESTAVPTVVPTDEPTIPPTPEPVLTSREQVVTVAGDTSVTGLDPDLPQAGQQDYTLTAGGSDAATTVLTFQVEGVGAGTVVSAQLVLTGAGDASGQGGQLLVGSGIWFDENSLTMNQLANTPLAAAGWVDTIQPGVETRVDVTGVVTADGTVSFVLQGTPEQIIGIWSREGGAPAYLVLTIEEWTYPEGSQ